MSIKIKSLEEIPHMKTEDLQEYLAAHGEQNMAKETSRPMLVTRAKLVYLRGDGKTPSPEVPRSAPLSDALSLSSTEKPEKKKKAKGKATMSQQEANAQMEAGESDRIYPRCSKCAIAICDGTETLTAEGTFCKEHAPKSKAHSAQEETKMKTSTAKKSTAKAGLKTKRDAKATKAALKTAAKKSKTVARGAVAAGSKREPIGKDEYGFRAGSALSLMLDALKKGATMDELKKISLTAPSRLSEFKKPFVSLEKTPYSREVVVEENEKTGKIKMKSYKGPDGKKHIA